MKNLKLTTVEIFADVYDSVDVGAPWHVLLSLVRVDACRLPIGPYSNPQTLSVCHLPPGLLGGGHTAVQLYILQPVRQVRERRVA
jgi:hypothetical protein